MEINEQIARTLGLRAVCRCVQGDFKGAVKDIKVAVEWGRKNNFPELSLWEDNLKLFETKLSDAESKT